MRPNSPAHLIQSHFPGTICPLISSRRGIAGWLAKCDRVGGSHSSLGGPPVIALIGRRLCVRDGSIRYVRACAVSTRDRRGPSSACQRLHIRPAQLCFSHNFFLHHSLGFHGFHPRPCTPPPAQMPPHTRVPPRPPHALHPRRGAPANT